MGEGRGGEGREKKFPVKEEEEEKESSSRLVDQAEAAWHA